MTVKACDHSSVGMIVRRGGDILLIERRKPPYGYAPPAGHVDDDATYEASARRELSEEVGLGTLALKLLLETDAANRCRRPGGSWHHWKVYEVTADGEVTRSDEETKRAVWAGSKMLGDLAAKTRLYLDGEISDDDWQANPGLEPVWYDHFQRLGIIQSITKE